MNDRLVNFDVQVYGALVPYDATKSLARCRTFYKYSNRNGGYITDTFAEKLIASFPYTPIKGIYSNESQDFTDHGRANDIGRIYGVVPVNNNFAWEEHLDEDGVVRTYACTDVLIYTALYKEAKEIVGKSQSMELYRPSIKGEWKLVDGLEQYVYTDGCFLGLQALGDEVEPAFEGASFYSLKEAFKSLLNDVYEYDLKNKPKGEKTMINFDTTDSRYQIIWSTVNSNFNEESNWTANTNVVGVSDSSIYTQSISDFNFYYQPYTVNTTEDGTITYTLGENQQVEALFVSAEEKAMIESLKEKNGGTFENLLENFALRTDFEQKITELTDTISTLETEKETTLGTYTALKEQFDELQVKFTAAVDQIAAYELVQKEAVLAKFAKKLDSSIIERYRENLSNFTVTDLNKDLAYELVEADASIFSDSPEGSLIPKDNKNLSGLEAALSKHLK